MSRRVSTAPRNESKSVPRRRRPRERRCACVRVRRPTARALRYAARNVIVTISLLFLRARARSGRPRSGARAGRRGGGRRRRARRNWVVLRPGSGTDASDTRTTLSRPARRTLSTR